MISRRSFLKDATATSVASSVSLRTSASSNPVSIGLYITEKAHNEYGSRKLNSAAHYVDDLFQEELGQPHEYEIGPVEIVSFEANKSAKRTARKWKRRDIGTYTHSNILILSSEETNWERWLGWAFYHSPYGVMTGYQSLDREVWRFILCHEIGHNFNLRHRDASYSDETQTIMGTKQSKQTIDSFSQKNINKITDSL